MLAHKSSMPISAGSGGGGGLGASSASTGVAREYQASTTSHSRTPLTGSTQSGTFASPTESEFSEAHDGSDAVRYAPIFLDTFERFARTCAELARKHNLPLRYDELPLPPDQLPFRQYKYPKQQHLSPLLLAPPDFSPIPLEEEAQPLPEVCVVPARKCPSPERLQQALPALPSHASSFPPPQEMRSALEIWTDGQSSTWDERRVAEWLRSISCGQYTDAFKGEIHSP